MDTGKRDAEEKCINEEPVTKKVKKDDPVVDTDKKLVEENIVCDDTKNDNEMFDTAKKEEGNLNKSTKKRNVDETEDKIFSGDDKKDEELSERDEALDDNGEDKILDKDNKNLDDSEPDERTKDIIEEVDSEDNGDDGNSENDDDEGGEEEGSDDDEGGEEEGSDDDEDYGDNEEEGSDGAHSEDENEVKSDPYLTHFEYELPSECTEASLNPQNPRLKYKLTGQLEMPGLGDMNVFKMFPSIADPPLNKKELSQFPLKKNLLESVGKCKKLSALELSFLNIITNYLDVIYCKQYFKVRGKLRRVYCVHLLNHILKSKARIIHHNTKCKKNPELEYRDQGFTQPTVLILAPFRGDCHRIVNQIISLLPKKCKIMNKSRFEKEYGPTTTAKSKNKPEDYFETFDGNNSEDYKIGLRIQNEHLTLYSNFYKSDLIVASPLGLRPIIGDINNKKGDADFLSSIEVLIVDRLDVLMIQNSVHLTHVLQCLNPLVKKDHEDKKIDYFRVREYFLDKKAKYYRQNIYLSSVEDPSIIYNYYMSNCYNFKGHLRSHDWVPHPMIEFVYPAMQMCFRIVDSTNPLQEYKDRRTFFIEKVLPEFIKDKSTVQTLIYVPSYFDYVELRHHFRAEGTSCFMMCEYTDKGKKAQGRNLFYKGHRHFMMYTERTHFYFRYWIKGIQHVIFYKLPTFPKFFREICNSMMDSHPNRKEEERTCTVIATPRDFLQLKHIIGIQEADRMLKSKQKTFVKYVGS